MASERETLPARLGLLEAVRRILVPLARAAIRQGITPEVFVSAAREAVTPGATEAGGNAPAAGAIDYELALRLAGRWLSEAPYSNRGRPRPLRRRGPGSFEELATRVGADHQQLLEQLRAVGALRVDTRDRVVLVDAAYLPAAGQLEKLDILGRDGGEFIETIMYNVSANLGSARLQRKASYDNIGSRALPSLRRHLRALAVEALSQANRTLAAVDRDRVPKAPGGRRTRVSFGIYVAEEALVRRARPRTEATPVTRGAGRSKR
ncbi:MAG: hypothetical protein HY699_04315 [Deltaproteobacteria bacterium]|nr:hypothetical protein [Deltaproteobacteria bacterium]